MAVEDQQQEALERIREAKRKRRRTLELASLGLKSLPLEITELTRLRSLDLRNNQLTSLPAEIGKLTNLTGLDLAGNQFASLPPEIEKLTDLMALILSDNKFVSLSPVIGSFIRLEYLLADGNQLSSLPPELGGLKKLVALTLRGNPLPEALLELAEKDTRGALAYIRDEGIEGGEPLYEAKLVLVGEGDVGKTCLLHALQGKPFKRQQTTKELLQNLKLNSAR